MTEFADKFPAQVWAILIHQGCDLRSIRTMYRVRRRRQDAGDRRRQERPAPGPARTDR